MELKQLQSFLRIADLGSFSKAGIALDIAQPALSRQIRLLEVELGTALFVRHGRGVRLTERGRVLVDHARGIIYQCDRAAAVVRSPEQAVTGHIVVGLPPSLCRLLAVPLLTAGARQYPALKIAIREGLSSYLLDWIAAGSLDCAVVYNAPAGKEFALTPMGMERRLVISSRRWEPLPAQVSVKRLAQLPLVLPARPHATRLMIDALLDKHGLKPTIVAEIDGISAILEMVKNNFGHAVLPRSALAASNTVKALIATPIAGDPINSRIAIATAARRPDALAQRAVSELLVKLVAGVLREI